MQPYPRYRLRFLVLCLTGVSLLFLLAFRFQKRERSHSSISASASRISNLPAIILWAWERPEQLDFVDPEKIGVAFLAKTIYLRSDRVIGRPRLQPLAVPPGAAVIAVARIESDQSQAPKLSPEQIKDTASEIAELSKLPNVVMVQVDFDATRTEREFYRELLTQLRGKLPPSTALSITALASWCQGDNWLEDLPVDEAVPMLFRMGVEREQFRSRLAAGQEFNSKPCQSSAGISTDEPLAKLPHLSRFYVFNPKPWSQAAVNQITETLYR